MSIRLRSDRANTLRLLMSDLNEQRHISLLGSAAAQVAYFFRAWRALRASNSRCGTKGCTAPGSEREQPLVIGTVA